MLKFPMKFEPVEAAGNSGIANNWTTWANELPPIPIAIPPEFAGPGGGYSPEDLLGIALLNCLVAMYKVYCAKAKIEFQEIKGSARVTVNKDPSSPVLFVSQIDVHLDVTGASDVAKAKELLESAIKDCIISNSLKATKSYHTNVS